MGLGNLLQQLHLEIPGYQGAAAGSIEGGFFESHSMGDVDPQDFKSTLVSVAKQYHNLYEELGGPVDFGSNDEVLISASRGYVLVKMHHASGRFMAVFLASSGNIGYLRFRIRTYMRDVISA
ncbi:MAG: hypothetical protein JXX28_16485 [Deltaproteobacteria bacterium]|nr:hypothetical protein [Deltaproteobacteria bacterium]